MDVTFQIPDDLASRVAATGDVSRRALEAFALEEFKAGNITQPELRRVLGLARIEMDGFQKSHGIYEDVTFEDVERDIAELSMPRGIGSCNSSSPSRDSRFVILWWPLPVRGFHE